MKRIYLDFNATTPIAPSVIDAMHPFITVHYGNPSSEHAIGIAAKQAVEDGRECVAEMLGASSDEIVFTSGGTESNNLALKGVMFQKPWSTDRHLIISAIEHPAVSVPATFLRNIGFEVSVCGVDENGRISVDEIASLIQPNTRLVSVMHANNEIGTIQPIREISDVCRPRGILLHTDAAQSLGKIRVDVNELGVDLLTVAGHKVYAPKGVGALYVRHGVGLEPLLHGADHETGMRSGTENVASIVGLGHAGKLVSHGSNEMTDRLASLRDSLLGILQREIPEISVNGAGAEKLPNTLSVNFPDTSGHEMLARIPELCGSTGAACHSGDTSMSATLAAINLSPETAQGTVRLSIGWQTSKDEIERAASMLIWAWESTK